MRLTVGSDLKWRVEERSAKPLLFEPEIDWTAFAEPNIIHAY
jgi:hypothetical protein